MVDFFCLRYSFKVFVLLQLTQTRRERDQYRESLASAEKKIAEARQKYENDEKDLRQRLISLEKQVIFLSVIFTCILSLFQPVFCFRAKNSAIMKCNWKKKSWKVERLEKIQTRIVDCGISRKNNSLIELMKYASQFQCSFVEKIKNMFNF